MRRARFLKFAATLRLAGRRGTKAFKLPMKSADSRIRALGKTKKQNGAARYAKDFVIVDGKEIYSDRLEK